MGAAQLGHLNGPTGLTLPQNGHTFASGGLSWLQYRQGRLKLGIPLPSTSMMAKRYPMVAVQQRLDKAICL